MLSKFLNKILTTYIPKPASYIKNSIELKSKIDSFIIPEGYTFISLDVISLFSNTDVNLMIEAVKEKWKCVHNNINLSLEEFCDGIKFVVCSNFFQFNNKFFQQIFGSAMGSPVSPILCDLVLQKLENDCINKLCFDVPFYYRYVDDIILCVPKNLINYTLNVFNNYNENLQFTVELMHNNIINFLDMQLIVQEDSIITNWYRKPTHSGRYLNYYSHHPITQKIGIVYSLVDYSIKLSHPKYHHSNIKLTKELLTLNDYPLDFINKYISKRLITISNTDNFVHNIKKTINPNKPLLILPYFNHFFHVIRKLSIKHNFNIIFKCVNKFSKFITLGKDPIQTNDRNNIVYKINCSNCNCCYVGQSSRSLKIRVNEHKRDCKNFNERSALVEHMTEFNNHHFNFDKVKILDSERNKNKRLFSEMIFIHNNNNSINRQLDTLNLKACYKAFIDKNRQT